MPKRSAVPWMDAATRRRLERIVAELIDILDRVDGDPEMEEAEPSGIGDIEGLIEQLGGRKSGFIGADYI